MLEPFADGRSQGFRRQAGLWHDTDKASIFEALRPQELLFLAPSLERHHHCAGAGLGEFDHGVVSRLAYGNRTPGEQVAKVGAGALDRDVRWSAAYKPLEVGR